MIESMSNNKISEDSSSSSSSRIGGNSKKRKSSSNGSSSNSSGERSSKQRQKQSKILSIPSVAAIITNLTPPQPHGNSNKWKHTFSNLTASGDMTNGNMTNGNMTSGSNYIATSGGSLSNSSPKINNPTTDSKYTETCPHDRNYTTTPPVEIVLKKPTPKVFQCCGYGDCSMIFSRKFFLERHIRMHKGEKPFQCDVCMKHFSRNDNLKQHKHSVHKGTKTLSTTTFTSEGVITTMPSKNVGEADNASPKTTTNNINTSKMSGAKDASGMSHAYTPQINTNAAGMSNAYIPQINSNAAGMTNTYTPPTNTKETNANHIYALQINTTAAGVPTALQQQGNTNTVTMASTLPQQTSSSSDMSYPVPNVHPVQPYTYTPPSLYSPARYTPQGSPNTQDKSSPEVLCDASGRPLVVQPVIVTKDSLDTLLSEQHKSAHKRKSTTGVAVGAAAGGAAGGAAGLITYIPETYTTPQVGDDKNYTPEPSTTAAQRRSAKKTHGTKGNPNSTRGKGKRGRKSAVVKREEEEEQRRLSVPRGSDTQGSAGGHASGHTSGEDGEDGNTKISIASLIT